MLGGIKFSGLSCFQVQQLDILQPIYFPFQSWHYDTKFFNQAIQNVLDLRLFPTDLPLVGAVHTFLDSISALFVVNE